MPVSRKRKKRHPRKKVHKVPRATVSLEPKHHDLTTLPEGYVKLRRMSYGELLTSNDMAFAVNVSQNGGSGNNDPNIDVGASTARIAEYRFKNCIVDHNLENEVGTKLDFKNPQATHLLDPNVGQEIDNLITRMHNWQETVPNSETPSTGGSSATNDQNASSVNEQSTSPSSSSD